MSITVQVKGFLYAAFLFLIVCTSEADRRIKKIYYNDDSAKEQAINV